MARRKSQRREVTRARPATAAQAGPPPSGKAWGIEFFRRVPRSATPAVPGKTFLDGSPEDVRAELMATLVAVRDAPPPSFSGGLRWRSMHGVMAGWHEARTKRGQRLYRLFCIVDRNGPGLPAPSIIIVTGGVKPHETAFSDAYYRRVAALGREYRASDPRSILR